MKPYYRFRPRHLTVELWDDLHRFGIAVHANVPAPYPPRSIANYMLKRGAA